MCRPLASRCLAALLVVATLMITDVGGSGPVGAQTGATPRFSDEAFYTDVSPGSGPTSAESLYRHIQSLARAGVFAGTDCGVGRFCPDAHMQQWQLAVWLMRSLGEDDLGDIDRSRFADVDADEWWAPYVERMAELGITGGCSSDPMRYCPEGTVSRGELAAFLSRALDLPAAGPAGFTDIEGHTHADAINRAAEARLSPRSTRWIVGGCSQEPPKYCPDSPVTKAQMAVFIFRALDWRQLNTIAESSRVPDDIFLTDYNEFSWYVKTQVIDRYGDNQPWLRTAWNVTNRSTFGYKYSSYYPLAVHYGRATPQTD